MKKKINIVDSGVEDIISSMANSLDISYTTNKNEYVLELPKEFGDGTVKGHGFDHGFGMVDAEYVLKKDFHFEMEKGVVHPLKILFNMGDDYQHKLEHEPEFKTLGPMETMIVASTPKNNHRFLIPSKTRTSIFSLEINRKLFGERIVDFMDVLDPELEELFKDTHGILPFFFKTGMSYDIVVMIEEYRNCQSKGLARVLYLEAKAYEILASFIQLYLDNLRKSSDRTIFRHNHLKAIKSAGDYIKAHLDTALKAQEIARKQGVSVNILQNGFRTLYGMSINEFIQNERLLLAKKLLEADELSISQIGYEIGINSKSYVSKLFVERFGMTPSTYREKFKKQSGTR